MMSRPTVQGGVPVEHVNWIAAYTLGAAFSRVDEQIVIDTLVGSGLDQTVLPEARAAVSAVVNVDEAIRDAADALMIAAATQAEVNGRTPTIAAQDVGRV